MARTTTTTALDAQDLRERLRRRLLWTTSLCALAATLATISAVVLAAVDRRLSAEQARFVHYPGEILEVHDDGGDSSTGWVTVEFTQHGRDRTADVDIDNTASFSTGPATVLVDPHDHGFVTLPGENYFPLGQLLAIVLVGGFGVVAIAFGGAAVQTHRNYRVLAASTWETLSGFVTRVRTNGNDNSARWVLFLPEHEGGSFWVFTRALPMPRFTGSVAIDRRGRLVYRVGDGKRLASAKRSWIAGPWARHHVTSATRTGNQIVFHYRVHDEPQVCTIAIADLDDDLAATLTDATLIDLLQGPPHAVAVHVPWVGIIGVGSTTKASWRERRRLRRTDLPATA